MQSIPKPMERNGYGIPLSSANCNLNFENKLNIKERNVDDAAAAAALEFVFFSHPSDCRRFFFCQTTIPRPLECEQHLAFDLETMSCIKKSLVPRWYARGRMNGRSSARGLLLGTGWKNIYNNETNIIMKKTGFLSVCLSTFYIFRYFSNIILS